MNRILGLIYKTISLSSILGLVSCGSPAVPSSSLASNATKWQPAVIQENIVVTEINGGINPDYFGYNIAVEIFAGSNPCNAMHTEVRLVTKTVGRSVFIVGESRSRGNQEARICTMEYAPVYLTAAVDVRASRNLVDHVIIKNVGEMNNDKTVESFIEVEAIAIVDHVTFTTELGGINPDAFAIKVVGSVMLGQNSCFAQNAKARFVAAIEGRDLVVKALVKKSDFDRICIEIYQPVITSIDTVVRGMKSESDRVVVRNYETIGEEAIYKLN